MPDEELERHVIELLIKNRGYTIIPPAGEGMAR
jgi:hypothetical protein